MQIHCLPNFDRKASGSDKRHFPAGGGGSQWGLIGESGNQVGGCVKTDKSKLYKHLEEQVHEFISLLENVSVNCYRVQHVSKFENPFLRTEQISLTRNGTAIVLIICWLSRRTLSLIEQLELMYSVSGYHNLQAFIIVIPLLLSTMGGWLFPWFH